LLAYRAQQQLDEIKKILLTVRATAVKPPTDDAAGRTVSVDGANSIGSATAKLVLIEYSDYECPFCGEYARGSYDEIKRRLVQADKAQYVFKSFPLERSHPDALKSAEAAQCAGEQGQFSAMHDLLFQNQRQLALSNLKSHASTLGLDPTKFEECMGGRMTATVRAQQQEGRELGVNATPTLLIAERQGDGTVRVRRKLVGAVPAASLMAMLSELGF
jgi:protein-disulfide isomerase